MRAGRGLSSVVAITLRNPSALKARSQVYALSDRHPQIRIGGVDATVFDRCRDGEMEEQHMSKSLGHFGAAAAELILLTQAELEAFAEGIIARARVEMDPRTPVSLHVGAVIVTGPLTVSVEAYEAHLEGCRLPLRPGSSRCSTFSHSTPARFCRADACSSSSGPIARVSKATAHSTFTCGGFS